MRKVLVLLGFTVCLVAVILSLSSNNLSGNTKDVATKVVPQKIEDKIKGKSSAERATLKGVAIEELGPQERGVAAFSNAAYEIEITRIQAIEGGAEVYARVWRTDGSQIGFGVKGDVDVERFVIINPPILVSDPQGDEVRTIRNTFTGETFERRFRVDPKAALLETLAHTVSLKKEKFGPNNITRGKVGNTTTTVFSDAGGDGFVRNQNATSWAASRSDATGDSVFDTASSDISAVFNASANNTIHRAFFPFDTSSITDTDVVSAATMSVYGDGAAGANVDSIDADIVGNTQASNTALTTADYDQLDTTSQGTSIAFSSWAAGYNAFTLNATGIANVSKTGFSKYAVRGSRDTDNVAPTGNNYISMYFSDNAGTTNDPKLVVEHAAPVVTRKYQDVIWDQ